MEIYTFKKLNESQQKSTTLVSVDIQPGYVKNIRFNIQNFMTYLNSNAGNYKNVLYLFNGPDLGLESEQEIKYWMLEHGLEEETLDYIEFYDKGYGWFRSCMDSGYGDILMDLLLYMYKKKVDNTEEMKEKDWEFLIKKNSDMIEFRKFVEGEGGVYFPDVFEILKNLTKIDIIGGAQEECLAEVIVMLDVLNKKYNLIHKWIF